LIEQLERFEPYGQENAEPVFLTRGAIVESARLVGANQDHSKLTLSHNGVLHQAIFFRCSDTHKKLVRGDKCNVVYTIQTNEWRGEKTIQLMIKELWPL
jgi:single-stranded-DNA-specific exonuclease